MPHRTLTSSFLVVLILKTVRLTSQFSRFTLDSSFAALSNSLHYDQSTYCPQNHIRASYSISTLSRCNPRSSTYTRSRRPRAPNACRSGAARHPMYLRAKLHEPVRVLSSRSQPADSPRSKRNQSFDIRSSPFSSCSRYRSLV